MTATLQKLSAGLFLAYLAALAALLAFYFQCPPLADYAEWVYQSHIIRELLGGAPSNQFYIRDYPVPYVASQLVMVAMGQIIGPIFAGKANIALYLALAGFVSRKFVNSYDLDPVIAYPLLLSCIVCNSSFWSGYINYQYGLLLLMAYLASSESTKSCAWANAAFATLAFFCHGFCLFAFFVIAGLRALWEGWRPVCMFVLACLPCFVLTAWYMVSRSNDAMPPMGDIVPYGGLKFWAYKVYTLAKAGPYQNFMLGSIGDHERMPTLYYAGIALNLGFSLLLAVIQFGSLRSTTRQQNGYLHASAALLGLVFFFSPSVGLQVVNPGERILYPQLLCSFALALKPGGIKVLALPVRNKLMGVTYMALFAMLVSLVAITKLNEGKNLSLEAPQTDALNSRASVLFWHRPYQFQGVYLHLEQVDRTGDFPSKKINFPTSILANRKDSP